MEKITTERKLEIINSVAKKILEINEYTYHCISFDYLPYNNCISLFVCVHNSNGEKYSKSLYVYFTDGNNYEQEFADVMRILGELK